MRVDPDPAELLGRPACIHLPVEIVRYGAISELHRHGRALLPDEDYVGDEQQVARCCYAEPADFRFAEVAEVQQLRPGVRSQPQRRHFPAELPALALPVVASIVIFALKSWNVLRAIAREAAPRTSKSSLTSKTAFKLGK